jgi:hypothetical protein
MSSRRAALGLCLALSCARLPALEELRFACDNATECIRGQRCFEGTCVPAEANCVVEDCTDGADNDCDGLADCEDDRCLHQACDASRPAAVCCGLGVGECRDLASDEENCGGCGSACGGGESCQAAGGSGWCTCDGDGDCPTPASGTRQDCSSGHCECSSNSQCADGQSCFNDEHCTY